MQKPNRQAVLINGGILFGAIALIVGATQSASAGPSSHSDLASVRTTLSTGHSPATVTPSAAAVALAAAGGNTPLTSASATSPAPIVLPPVANPAPAKQNPATIVVTAPAPPANAGSTPKKKTTTPKVVSKPVAAAAAPAAGSSYPEHADIANAIYAQINSERAANGLARPRPQQPAQQLGARPQRGDGQHRPVRPPGDRARRRSARASRATGYHWTWAGENIAWGSYASVVVRRSRWRSQMYNEPPNQPNHRANILSTSAHNVGVDVITDGSGKMWITCDFGS